MKNSRVVPIVAALLAGLVFPLQAQAQGGAPGGMHPAVLQMFGKNNDFTSEVHVRMLENGRENLTLVMQHSMLKGMVRADMDMARMKGPEVPPEAIEQMKAMGTDRISTIMRPDKKANYVIYPGLKAYVDMELSREEADALEKEPKVEKTELGKETLDGQPCVKNKIVIADPDGERHELLVWNAVQLKDFPIQIEMSEGNSSIQMRYRNVKFEKPNAAQFEPPPGFKKYASMEELQQVIIQKMLGGFAQ